MVRDVSDPWLDSWTTTRKLPRTFKAAIRYATRPGHVMDSIYAEPMSDAVPGVGPTGLSLQPIDMLLEKSASSLPDTYIADYTPYIPPPPTPPKIIPFAESMFILQYGKKAWREKLAEGRINE